MADAMKILITGMAGFIGYSVAKRLAADGHSILGVDNLNDYYDVSLKRARLQDLEGRGDITFQRLDLSDRDATARLFDEHEFERVIHLAAQPGVRYSIDHPHVYAEANLVAHLNVLEGCRHQRVDHLIYASSSSVYGMHDTVPFSVSDNVDRPVSLYAATKKANELMAYTYSHLYDIPATGLRFFTVYGPWGRPDMAMFKFTRAVLAGEPIEVYNNGEMSRDFTFIDDIVEGVVRIMAVVPERVEGAAHALHNIGNGSPVELMAFIRALESATGKQAVCRFLPMQPGDVPRTFADVEALYQATGYRPRVKVEEGVARFVAWYRDYYGV